MRKLLIAVTLSSLLLIALPVLAEPAPLFSQTNGFATKTGFRGVFSWATRSLAKTVVNYGTSPTALDQQASSIVGSPDTAGMAIAEGLTPGSTYYWEAEDLLSGEKSDIKSFTATNAYNDWDATAGTYTIDVLVQIDTESLPQDVPHDLALKDISQGVSIWAERLYDALDGYVRIGNVLVTDTNLDYSANQNNPPAGSPPRVCEEGNFADVLVQTGVPFDSHTWSGWAISNPCISFYVGRIGQLVVPWGDIGTAEDLHFGGVAAHEMMHYAFNAPDLYTTEDINDPRSSGCWNLDWDGSLMHNSGAWTGSRWELTELDRNQAITPCDHQFSNTWTWPELRKRYVNVPDENTPPQHVLDTQARGNEDGGALNIQILDREPGASTLTNFTPDDSNPPPGPDTLSCTATGPVLIDPQGDATSVANVNGVGPNEAALDIREARIDWNSTFELATFTTKVTDLGTENPETAPNIDFGIDFDYDGATYAVDAFRFGDGSTRYSFQELVASPRVTLGNLNGSFDAANETISVELPKAALEAAGVKPFAFDDELTNIAALSRRGYTSNDFVSAGAVADRTDPGCPYTIGRGAVAKPGADEVPDGYLTVSSPRYQWEGDILVDAVAPFTGFNAPSQCDGTAANTACERQLVHVTPAAGGSPLKFVIKTSDPNSFIVNVYGPDGKLWQSHDGLASSENVVEGDATLTGVYTVVIRPWDAAAAHYSAYGYLGDEPPPGIDGSLSSSNTRYEWDGVTRTEVGAALDCDGISEYACETTKLQVTPPAGGGTVTITALSNDPTVNDIDVYVYDSNGVEVNKSANPGGDEALNFNVSSPAVYDVVIKSYLAIDATYHAVATLNDPLPPPPPAPAGDYEAEISLGGSYGWEGDPPNDANLVFTCASLVSFHCDNTLVKVNVPAGGARLTVKITADNSDDVFDLWVYDPDGNQYKGGTSNETYVLDVTKSGIYRIGVTTFLVFGTYHGTISRGTKP